MSNKWNRLWSIDKFYNINMNQCVNDNYFIHFAGHVDYHLIPSIKLENKLILSYH